MEAMPTIQSAALRAWFNEEIARKLNNSPLLDKAIDESYTENVKLALQEPQYIIDLFADRQTSGTFHVTRGERYFKAELQLATPRYMVMSLPGTTLIDDEATEPLFNLYETVLLAEAGDKEAELTIKLLGAPMP